MGLRPSHWASRLVKRDGQTVSAKLQRHVKSFVPGSHASSCSERRYFNCNCMYCSLQCLSHKPSADGASNTGDNQVNIQSAKLETRFTSTRCTMVLDVMIVKVPMLLRNETNLPRTSNYRRTCINKAAAMPHLIYSTRSFWHLPLNPV